MRTVLLVAALVALAWPAQANVYVCVVLHVYDEEDGELVAAGQAQNRFRRRNRHF